MSNCYHCGLPIPSNVHLSVTILGEQRAMCCNGCHAVASAIVSHGGEDYYRFRTENSPTGKELVPEFLKQTTVYDNPVIQKRFVRQESEHILEASLILEGITCAACVWLNERHLRTLDGVLDVQVNYTTHRARVRWDNRLTQLSTILQAVSQIGYIAHPYDPARQQEVLDRERSQYLKRVGLAGVLGMQIMMFALAIYSGQLETGIEYEFHQLFNWINLILVIPILLYSAVPFFQSAWRDLKLKQAGMDVPVSLGLILAFLGSVWVTVQGEVGHVYYDSIAMFVFLLLTGRYFELIARQRSAQAAESLVHLVPTMTTRLQTADNNTLHEELILVADLQVGDVVLIRPGESIPADGIIINGQSSIDESLLTGESYPLAKTVGNSVVAGTINIESPLQIKIDKVGAETVISHILRLLERAQSEKPALTQLADRVASWFVLVILALAGLIAIYWYTTDPSRWLEVTLSVLVVTCPCALSLATPTAITAATSTLTRSGLLITRGHALETLARATHFIFDKTGTLTAGRLQVVDTHTMTGWSLETCLAYASALEKQSEHPIATAILNYAQQKEVTAKRAENVINHLGAGLQGEIDGQTWFIGTAQFIQQHTGNSLTTLSTLQADGHTLVLLADKTVIYAAFLLSDEIRQGAETLITALKQQGKTVVLLTGDHWSAARRVAFAVGIEQVHAELQPEDKLNYVKELQSQQAVIAMIGDGVNDAPVLAQAQVSIAMGCGTQVARASADMILLSEQLPQLLVGIHTAQRTLRVIRQNLLWAAGYNFLALPSAAMGAITPWIAAIGMSLSSLLVVLNALRLVEKKHRSESHKHEKM